MDNRFIGSLTGFLLVVVLTSTSLYAGSFDPDPTAEQSKITEQFNKNRKELWRGRTASLYFEMGTLNAELLSVSATPRRLYISTGKPYKLLQGQLVKRLPGGVVHLDLHSVPQRSNFAAISLTYFARSKFKSAVLSLYRHVNGTLELNTLYQGDWQLVRPLGNQFYRQTYSPSGSWENPFERLTTTQSSYEVNGTLSIMKDALLSSTTKIDENLWSTITSGGELVVVDHGRIASRINGNFNASVHRIKPGSKDDQSNKSDPLRLPAVYFDDRNQLVVIRNPKPSSGYFSWLFGETKQATLEMFDFKNPLQHKARVGPLPGRILDFESSRNDGSKLFWLRRENEKTVILESVDLSPVSKGS
ncbi:MAG: hypothetical protein ABEK50_08375 [bacterium]